MRRIDLQNKFAKDETVIDDIIAVSNQIFTFTKRIGENYYTKEGFKDAIRILNHNIYEVLKFWTGSTYLGKKKDPKLANSFTAFFSNLLELIIVFKNKGIVCDLSNALYQGKIYRVLGHGESGNNLERIEPYYSKNFVSWSKSPDILTHYFKQKLHEPITKIEATVIDGEYAIDLEALKVSKPGEREVVYPTKENAILNISYIDRETEDNL